jgi:hypothetical protein
LGKAYKVKTWYGGVSVIMVGNNVTDCSKNIVINIQSGRADSIADGIIRMLNEDQCPVCGKFNGLHGEVSFGGYSDGFGSVVGTQYQMCPNAKKG